MGTPDRDGVGTSVLGREGVGGKYTPPWGMGPAREVPARAAATARIADFILDGRKY